MIQQLHYIFNTYCSSYQFVWLSYSLTPTLCIPFSDKILLSPVGITSSHPRSKNSILAIKWGGPYICTQRFTHLKEYLRGKIDAKIDFYYIYNGNHSRL